MPQISYESVSKIGSKHHVNQDRVIALSNDAISLFSILDCMGTGDSASVALDLVEATLKSGMKKQDLRPNIILNTLLEIYRSIADEIQQKNLNVGVSATTVIVHEERSYIAHIGNTRAYAVSRQSFDQLTTDHTVEEKTVEFGMEFTGDQFAPLLYRALGADDAMPDTMIHPFPEGSGLLLITDGIYRAGAQLIEYDDTEYVNLPVSNDEIDKMIKSAETSADICSALIGAGEKFGGDDDLSVLFISNNYPFNTDNG